MDFIEHLPKSEDYIDILVIIDRLTKQVIFILIYNSINTTGLANLFVQNIFSKYRIPSYIMLDKRAEFISILLVASPSLEYEVIFLSRLLPKSEWPNQTHKPDLRAILANLL